ncbi:hypothetical protein CJU90_1483 [Yarrowia sp. C11]|nr:hypothetical protein CKK34_0207 [Yarrowia sp. E02]KAG5371453.1 hypothetical protein CJU90_1483 [Yarrowia sp. C11]
MRENGSLRSARSVSSLNSVDSSATIQPADRETPLNAPSVYPRTASATASTSSTSAGASSVSASTSSGSISSIPSSSSSSSIAPKRVNGGGAPANASAGAKSATQAPGSTSARSVSTASQTGTTPAPSTSTSQASAAATASNTNNNSSNNNATATTTAPADPPRRRTRNTSASSASELGITPARTQYCVVIVLSSRNNTFDRKSLVLPFYPEVLKLGRQTSAKTLPSPDNGYFDSRVLSRQHAEIWADKLTRKVWMKDAKSSNGTYINGERLSQDGRESEPHELKRNDLLELGIDIANTDGSALLHRKISAVVERISVMSLQSGDSSLTQVNVLGNGSGVVAQNNAGSNSQQLTQNQTLTSQSQQTLVGPPTRVRPKKAEALDVALFGDVDTSLEDLALGHSRNSVGGLFMKSGISSSSNIETAVKTLAEQIHSTRVETAKLESVRKMLSQIQSQQKKHKSLKDERNEQMKEYASVELQQRVRDLETEVKQGNEKIHELETELERLRAVGASTAAAGVAGAAAIASAASRSSPDSDALAQLKREVTDSQAENSRLRERAQLAEQQAESSTIQLSLMEQQLDEYRQQLEHHKQQLDEHKDNKPHKKHMFASFTVLVLGIGFVVANKFFREHIDRWVDGITGVGSAAV